MSLELQSVSYDIWDRKYRLKDKDGNPIDQSLEDTFKRVARTLASVEKESEQAKWEKEFLWALNNGAVPAGRILSNIGALEHKPATSTINCTVSGTIGDSMDDILSKLHEAGLTLKAGCGIGYDFSTLRPKGAYVAGAGANTSGPLSFMDIYDKMCFTISSAGGRRGAQMATMDISHPDIKDFIKAKRENGRLRQFNLSVLITDEFMNAVKEDKDWNLVFDGVVYETLPAKELFDLIMQSSYDYAEPGFILIDEVNRMNNNWFCEDIRTTNPCGEQPLPPYGSCLLGSINLTKFVRKPFTAESNFDYHAYTQVIRVFTRMLDNVVELNGLPLEGQREEIELKRRHGMGFFGLGSVLNLLGIRYGSEKAVLFTSNISKMLATYGFYVGMRLAQDKGAAPLLCSQTNKDKFASSEYLAKFPKELINKIREHGCRFTHHSSIAPTGTISLSIGNNASNGIEPTFAHSYTRNVIAEGKNTKENVTVYSYEALLYKSIMGGDAELPDTFVTADDITPQEHIDMQAAAQYWIDSSISKTINVPTDYPYEDFKNIYMEAYEKKLKGCTTFRFNPDIFQGVLVRDEDLENTVYNFVLEDGSSVSAKGNVQVEYEGQVQSAANLFDAIKEGYFGKL